MLVKGITSKFLVDAHIMVKISVTGFSFWAYTVNYHFAKWLIECWNGLKRGRNLQDFFGSVSLPFDYRGKFCKILQHSAKFEANSNVWLSCSRFYR